MMQLATNPRPHPPPVPPRPSRQVVAEALKRSPRPPCPTRQAPPPPNTKPWRSEDHEISQERGGRTVIYESLKESSNIEDIRSSSEPRRSNESSQRDKVLPRRRSNDEIIGRSKCSSNIGKDCSVKEKILEDCGGTNRANGERYDAEKHRERQNKPPQQAHEQKSQLQQLRSNGKELGDWENSTVRSGENNDDIHSRNNERSLIPYDETNVNETSSMVANNPADSRKIGRIDEKNLENENSTRETNRCRSNDDAIAKNFERLMEKELAELANDNIAKTAIKEKSTNNAETNGTKSVFNRSSFVKNLNSQRSKTSGTRVSMTPTKIPNIQKVANEKDFDLLNKNDETINQIEEKDSVEKTYGSTTTISSDDCATVVVIDEPERKIAFNEDNDNIHHQDWLEAGVRYSSTKITLPGDETIDRIDELSRTDNDDDDNDDRNQENIEDESEHQTYSGFDFSSIRERIAMSSLQGLPPLPRSLSGFNLNEGRREAGEPPPPPARSSSKTPKNVKSTQPSSSRPSPPGRQLTTLDTQLAILRKEMFGLRQLDLSLLSQLWSLNESIQEFRQLLQDQEDRAPSPSPSSEEGDDTSYGSHPPPPPRRPAPFLHHHRPPRPPRPLRPPASDESPSSEEYGAV